MKSRLNDLIETNRNAFSIMESLDPQEVKEIKKSISDLKKTIKAAINPIKALHKVSDNFAKVYDGTDFGLDQALNEVDDAISRAEMEVENLEDELAQS